MQSRHKLYRALAYPLLWPVIAMPGQSYAGSGPPNLSFSERTVRREVESTVRHLAEQIGERNARNYQGLIASEAMITGKLRALGYNVRVQAFHFDGVQMHNIEAELPGTDLAHEKVVYGAHYDTVYGSPGADDNATGVAALLSIARALRYSQLRRTVRFVFFANEENPDSAWETMGSYAYAQECRKRGDNIVGMVSLEMLGVYSDEPGSQQYPAPFNLLYPDVGNFVGFVGNLKSRQWVRRCIASFRSRCSFPSEGVAAPEMFRDIRRSDHWSFWQFGYPALMVTDTSNFRNKLYHTDKDTPCIIDFSRLARVSGGLSSMLVDVAT